MLTSHTVDHKVHRVVFKDLVKLSLSVVYYLISSKTLQWQSPLNF